MKKVWISGYFDQNLGDDLFLKIIIERYKNCKFYFYSKFNYKNIIKGYNVKQFNNYSWLTLLRRIQNLFYKIFKQNKIARLENYIKIDFFTLISGSAFMEPDKYEEYTYNTRIRQDIPNYILGVNFGPYKSEKFFKDQKKIFENATDVCFRDKYSYVLYKRLDNVRMASDIVFSLNTNSVKISNEKRVIISVIDSHKDGKKIIDQNKYENMIVKLIDYFDNLNYKITLMSFSKCQGDEKVIENIIAKTDNIKLDKYFYRGNIDEALDVLGSSQIIIGSRFHANIIGFLLHKTVIPLAYSDKTINMLKDLNFKGLIIDLRNIKNFDINKIDKKILNYKLDITFQRKDAINHFKKLDEVLEVNKNE